MVQQKQQRQHDTTTANEKDDDKWVDIIDGKYKGATLRYLGPTAQRVAVLRPDGKRVYLLPPHVDLTTLRQDPVDNNNKEHNDNDDNKVAAPPDNNPWVCIVDGKHKGKTLRFLRHTKQMIAVQLPTGQVITLPPQHVDMSTDATTAIAADEPAVNTTTAPRRPVTPEKGHNPAVETTRYMERQEFEDHYDFLSASETLHSESQLTLDNPHIVEQEEEEEESQHIKHDNDNDDNMSFATALQDDSSLPRPGDMISIHNGKYAGQTAIFVKTTPERVAIRLQGEAKVRYLLPTSLVSPANVNIPSNNNDDDKDPLVAALRAHVPPLVRITNVTAEKSTHTLMGVMFRDKVVFVEVQHLEALDQLPTQFSIDENGCGLFHLVAVKVHDKAKSLTAAYRKMSADDNHHQVGQALLQTVGALDQLIPRKVAARLELLLSTAAHPIDDTWQASNFCAISEQSNVGCGFIPRRMLKKLLPSFLSPEDVCAVQVRIAIPSMGLFKGMLMEKPGIDQIQLPPSMKKVNTAVDAANDATAWIMLNQAGIFPSPLRIQQAAGGFQEARPISKMACWTLAQKGVSQTHLQRPNRQHSSLVGVADPTNGIPPECIFITGIVHQHQHHLDDEFGDEVIISRFPMTEASDARKLRILKERPSSMSSSDWDFLCSKPFGLVVFGNAAPSHRPMPEQISQGDLDGDQYFVCWDPYIVENAVIGDKPVFCSNDPPPRTLPTDWWTAALLFMADIRARKQSQKLIGRLHDRWLGKLRANAQKDAVAFGRAYKDALVRAKHGGNVDLPKHLWSEIPYGLRAYLNPI